MLKKLKRLDAEDIAIILIVLAALAAAFGVGWYLQHQVERELASFMPDPSKLPYEKSLNEIAKLRAEIQHIRSDTSGSLFWLKMVALFVTVGGAVGGYLAGMKSATRQRLAFERRKDIDAAYQGILAELAGEQPLLRAAAAVKLGSLLESFPAEWEVSPERRRELIDLTKRVLAASLSIEDDPTVLKTLSIALVKHKRWVPGPDNTQRAVSDCRDLNLSRAKAGDAYWAKADFSKADFYAAELTGASFRDSILHQAQFRNAVLHDTVFAGADCSGASFKLADLRRANFSSARLDGANFEGAKVSGVIPSQARLEKPLENPAALVTLTSPDGTETTASAGAWLRSHGVVLIAPSDPTAALARRT